jgi:toxin CptA
MTIALHSSCRLLLTQGLAHLVALGLLWPLAVPLALKALLAAAIAVSTARVVRRTRKPAVAALHLGKGGALEVETMPGTRLAATVLPTTTVLAGLTVLLLRSAGRTLALTLPADAMPADDHRQLRLWLKWQVSVT